LVTRANNLFRECSPKSVTHRMDREAALVAFLPCSSTWEGKVIKKAESGYKVLSEKGKNLGGPYKTKKEAEKRLQQVEFFKHKKG
jgi:hypothetical protein